MSEETRVYRQSITRVDLWSVFKISTCLYLLVLLTFLMAGIVLWIVAAGAGVVEGVEDFLGELFTADDFRIFSWGVLRGATLLGLILTSIMIILTLVGAALYNVFADLVGGIEVDVAEETDGF